MHSEPLKYNGKPMDLRPLNTLVSDVATRLRKGDTVAVRLEPGDATRYDLVLVPGHAVSDITKAYGVIPATHYIYVVCINLAPGRAAGTWHYILAGKPSPWDYAESISNEWSRVLIAHFMHEVSHEMRSQQAWEDDHEA